MTPGLAMIMSLAACGEEPASSSPGENSAPTSVSPSAPKEALTVQVKASANAAAKSWTLNCAPVGGDHPDAAKACAALQKAPDPFKAPPADQMCTKIYGGPQVATVKGTWQGKPVDAKFTRGDGCEVNRWQQLSPLFGGVPQ